MNLISFPVYLWTRNEAISVGCVAVSLTSFPVFLWTGNEAKWGPFSSTTSLQHLFPLAQLFMLTDVTIAHRHRKLQRWFQGGGILFSGYDMFRNLALGKNLKKQKQKQTQVAFQKFLLDPGEH